MGWDFINRQVHDRAAYLDGEFTGVITRVLRSAMVGSVYYAAAENIKPGGVPDVFAIVALTENRAGEFGYKAMDESMGPVEARCPVQILALLSPTKNDLANKWRERCWAYGGVVRSAEMFELAGQRAPDVARQGNLL